MKRYLTSSSEENSNLNKSAITLLVLITLLMYLIRALDFLVVQWLQHCASTAWGRGGGKVVRGHKFNSCLGN